MRVLLVALTFVGLFAGCLENAPAATPNEAPAADAAVAAVEPTLISWKGHIMQGTLDTFGHDQPTEEMIFDAQQAGYNLDVSEAPQAIEVRVDWKGAGGFALHPHWLVGDKDGRTYYWGYHSPTYTTGTGCIRLPDEDMQTGKWPMMVHPSAQTNMMDFTITVGLIGGAAKIAPELHGHRADGNYEIAAHEIHECQFLNKIDV